MEYIIKMSNGDELYHHGIIGQKWGIRRYQNPDGTLTNAGKKRYLKLVSENDEYRAKADKHLNKANKIRSRIKPHYFTDIGKERIDHQLRNIARNESKAQNYLHKIEKNNKKLSELSNDSINDGREWIKKNVRR